MLCGTGYGCGYNNDGCRRKSRVEDTKNGIRYGTYSAMLSIQRRCGFVIFVFFEIDFRPGDNPVFVPFGNEFGGLLKSVAVTFVVIAVFIIDDVVVIVVVDAVVVDVVVVVIVTVIVIIIHYFFYGIVSVRRRRFGVLFYWTLNFGNVTVDRRFRVCR